MLEGRGDPLPGGLGRVSAADAGLDDLLELAERHADRGAVRVVHSLVAADQCRERDALRRAEGRVPGGPVLHGANPLAGCGGR